MYVVWRCGCYGGEDGDSGWDGRPALFADVRTLRGGLLVAVGRLLKSDAILEEGECLPDTVTETSWWI